MEEEIHKNVADLSDKDIQKILRRESPELLVMLPDLQSKLQSLVPILKPFAEALTQQPPSFHNQALSTVGEEYIDAKLQTYLNYCMMLGSYMLLKSERKNVRDHPIMNYLVKSR